MMDVSAPRQQLEREILHAIAAGVVTASGDTFFRSLVEHVAQALRSSHAFVGEVASEQPTEASTISVWANGAHVDNFSYLLANTPCANVVQKNLCIHTHGVQQEYPEDVLLIEMGIESYAGMPLISSNGDILGLLVVLNTEELPNPEVVQSVLQVFGVRAATELERLRAEQALRAAHDDLECRVEERTAELSATNRSLRESFEMIEHDRQLTAYEIHDGIVQYVTALRMRCETLASRPEAAAIEEELTTIVDLATKTVTEGRALINGLKPPLLDEFGLASSIETLVEKLSPQLSIRFDETGGYTRLQPFVETAVYRMVQESLTNAVKHSQGTEVKVQLQIDENVIRIEIQDNGRGFAVDDVSTSRYGLRGIRERAKILDGTAKIVSSSSGTRIEVEIPRPRES